MTGRFVTFEGIDGSGKSTQLAALAARLRGEAVDVLETREPGGTALAEQLRALLLEKTMAPLTETLLMFAARIEHVDAVIVPALQRGRWVLCDRFTDASYAYQCGGRGVPADRIASLESWTHPALQPDLTVVIDLDPVEAARRRQGVRAPDRFEAEDVRFFERVRAVYLQRAAAQPQRFLLVDGAQPQAAIQQAIVERIRPWRA